MNGDPFAEFEVDEGLSPNGGGAGSSVKRGSMYGVQSLEEQEGDEEEEEEVKEGQFFKEVCLKIYMCVSSSMCVCVFVRL